MDESLQISNDNSTRFKDGDSKIYADGEYHTLATDDQVYLSKLNFSPCFSRQQELQL